jgi:hypothetical protein
VNIKDLVTKIERISPDDALRRAAPDVQKRVRQIIATKRFPRRADGSESKANELADCVSVVAERGRLTIKLAEPAGYVHQMPGRALWTDAELAVAATDALEQAMAEWGRP